MDNFNDVVVHLNHRDVTMAAVAIAPYARFAAYRDRMGWSFPVYSSAESDFNFDYHVSFTAEQMEAGKAGYNYRVDPIGMSEGAGVRVFVAGGGQIFPQEFGFWRGPRPLYLE